MSLARSQVMEMVRELRRRFPEYRVDGEV